MTDNNEVRGSRTMGAKPIAWITDTESADMHGWISCKAWSEGEFTTPLVLATDYAAIVAERDALQSAYAAMTRQAEHHMREQDKAEARAERLESDMRALRLNYDAYIERLEDALRTAREYVAAELEAERDRFKGFEHCGGIEGMAEDLAAIDAALEQEKGDA